MKLGDGTGVLMPDTQEYRSRYPQPSSQAEGVGFPQMRLAGVVCLSPGRCWMRPWDRLRGKGAVSCRSIAGSSMCSRPEMCFFLADCGNSSELIVA